MMLESLGSIAIELTARLAIRSDVGDQVLPLSVVFQTPPATPAAYMVAGVSGSINRARVRPAMLSGPRKVHVGRMPSDMMGESLPPPA
jgi:hypothetical protein